MYGGENLAINDVPVTIYYGVLISIQGWVIINEVAKQIEAYLNELTRTEDLNTVELAGPFSPYMT